MLEVSICVIVDFLQNGDHHSLSQCDKMSHFGGIYKLRCSFEDLKMMQKSIETVVILEKIAGILWCYINLKKKKKSFSYLPTLFFFKGHLKHRLFFFFVLFFSSLTSSLSCHIISWKIKKNIWIFLLSGTLYIINSFFILFICLTLLLLSTKYPVLANSVGPDQLASEEANWSRSALFAIKYMNL